MCSLIRDKGNECLQSSLTLWVGLVFSNFPEVSVLEILCPSRLFATYDVVSPIALKEGGIIIYVDDCDIQFSLSHMRFVLNV